MGIFVSKSTGKKLVVVAADKARRFRMAMNYGLRIGILDFTEVIC